MSTARGGDQSSAEPGSREPGLDHLIRALTADDPCGGDRDENGDDETNRGGKKDKENGFLPAMKDQRLEARVCHGRAAIASHERVG